MRTKKKINIYEYNNYRVLLRDWYNELKSQDRKLTQRKFASFVGFQAHSYLRYVIIGQRNLSEESVAKLTTAMELTGKSAEYFRLLVSFDQASSTEEKELYFVELNKIRRNTQFYKINKNQYSYFEQWYYPVIRELAVFSSWNGDYETLARLVKPEISATEAKRAVKTLIDIGLLQVDESGKYTQTSNTLSADDLPTHLIKKARNSYIKLALNASEELPPDKRNISCATVALGKKEFQEASALLDWVREKIVSLAEQNGSDLEKVYQLNIQLFPLSDSIDKNNHLDSTSTPEQIETQSLPDNTDSGEEQS